MSTLTITPAVPGLFADYLKRSEPILKANGINPSEIPIYQVPPVDRLSRALYTLDQLPPWAKDRVFIVVAQEKEEDPRWLLGVKSNVALEVDDCFFKSYIQQNVAAKVPRFLFMQFELQQAGNGLASGDSLLGIYQRSVFFEPTASSTDGQNLENFYRCSYQRRWTPQESTERLVETFNSIPRQTVLQA